VTRRIRLHAFEMACVGHIQQGLWRHPRDTAVDYASLDHWVELARLLERGLFDGLFLADVLGVYDVFGGTPDAALRHAVQVPNLDPMMLVPAMAQATTHLGFAVTASVGAEHPFVFARRMSTLDHLTRGRIGWNVVTGYLDSAARALGLPRQADHDARYDAADAFMAQVGALWGESWEDGAVLRDRAAGLYADPARVHEVAAGAMRGVHLCEPSPQRRPVIYQAGASARGLRFAADHAECVFVNATSRAQVAGLVADLRAAAAARGRTLRVFAGMTAVVGADAAEARAKCAEYERHASVEAALVQASGSMGVDFAALADDDPIRMTGTQAVVSNLAALTAGPVVTKAGFMGRLALGGRQRPVVGSPAQVADEMQGWMDAADLDGFVLARTVTPECFADFVDLVVPELQRRGVYQTRYREGTLREMLAA
jgi:FMN-dependent oxidoreductase (nitrilotriacetate monooxygenase family)